MKANSKWIWPVCEAGADQYGEFYQAFTYAGQKAELRISADSNYAVYINGQLAASNQYPDFPHYKVYDNIDLTTFCVKGVNHLAVRVWYYGLSNMSYVVGKAAVRYELWLDDALACLSDVHTQSRISPSFYNGYQKTITGQLGLSYWRDLSNEDGWMLGKGAGFASACVVEQDIPLVSRPIPKFLIGAFVPATLVHQEENRHFLFDLGRESVGYLQFELNAASAGKMMVCYGEHIADGGVRRLIGTRDFSVEYTLKPGKNEDMNPFRRLGLRYLEVFCEEPVSDLTMGICPTDYPVNHVEKKFENPLRQKIYDVSVRTLELCMHDHYEDTPWREQALYAMDSRNQMLCGYYAFQEYAFPRANLLLMSKDNRRDGLLSICFPNGDPLTIPSFSLHYFIEVYEYTIHSGDLTLIRDIYPKLQSVIQAFVERIEDGCLPNWQERQYWNFYEWSPGLSGALFKESGVCYDAALNCLLVMALQRMHEISRLLEVADDYLRVAEQVRQAIRERFYDAKDGSLCNSSLDNSRSVLVNALAILCGAVEGNEAAVLAKKLTDRSLGWTPATLSMVCFLYDALLKVDKLQYRDFILNDIDTKYQKMLDAGTSSFWETEDGESAFDRAGSLCHAWSSMPVYYYHLLNA